jgi:uncharacterized protein YqgQ
MNEKNIIFDLDHTIGFFEQMIHIMNYTQLSCPEILHLFPEMFRPLLFEFFHCLSSYKKAGKIKSILLYSNNNNAFIVREIIQFIHNILGESLFDEVITLEHPLRKKKQKDYHELLLLSNGILHEESLLCFVDDKFHPLMNTKNTYYIKCEGYVNYIKHSRVIELIQKEIPELKKKRCLNKNNQLHVSKLLIQKIRLFILR